MRISSWASPDGLPTKEWDSLTEGSTVYSTSGFLRVRHARLDPGGHARYLLARDGHGTAVAALETYSYPRPPRPLYHPSPLLAGLVDDDRVREMGERPLTVAAGWSEYRGQVPGLPGLAPGARAAAVDALAKEAFAVAESHRADVLGYFYLPREQAREVLRAYDGAGAVAVLHDVETSFPVGRWRDVDDYAAWLPAGRRKRARQEMRRFGRSGRTVREVRLPEVVATIAPLNSALMRRHGHDFGPERAAMIYGHQARFLGDLSSVLLVEEAGRVVGFVLRYRLEDMVYARVAGFDYSVPNHADYFNLVFYHPLQHGAGQQVREIHLGVNTLQAKLTRGAQPAPLYSVFVGVGRPLTAGAGAVRDHNRRLAADFQETHGRHVVGGVDTDGWLL
jgi:hypothetical protein